MQTDLIVEEFKEFKNACDSEGYEQELKELSLVCINQTCPSLD